MAATSGGLRRYSVQWDDRQTAYLKELSERHGLRSIAAAARMIVNAAIEAEQKARVAA